MKAVSLCSLPAVRLDGFVIRETPPNIKLSGIILKEDGLTTLMTNLESSDMFENVRLVSSKKNEGASDNAIDFEIEFNISKNYSVSE
jgi:hypothetical protein